MANSRVYSRVDGNCREKSRLSTDLSVGNWIAGYDSPGRQLGLFFLAVWLRLPVWITARSIMLISNCQNLRGFSLVQRRKSTRKGDAYCNLCGVNLILCNLYVRLFRWICSKKLALIDFSVDYIWKVFVYSRRNETQ